MKCGNCNQDIQASWKLCPYCGQVLKEVTASYPCPNCEYRVHGGWQICPECGFQIRLLSTEFDSSKNPDLRVSTYYSSLNPQYLRAVKLLMGMDMVYIYAGDFTMGSEKYEEEKPKREVFLNAFWMGKYAVTNEQYRIYVSESGCSPACFDQNPDFNWDKQPVVGVSFYEAASYCKWLKKKTDLNFRLTAEAEWEKAAGGTFSRKYPWGNCWEHDRCHSIELQNHRTSEIDCYPYGLSPYGLFNLAGNVWEWCQDWYDATYYKNAPMSNPKGPERGKERIVRGGAWNSNGNDMRISKRKSFPPNTRQTDIGFRIVCEDPVFTQKK